MRATQQEIRGIKCKNSDFDLAGEFVELNQLLKLAGLCDSGGAGKNMVASGVVSVDGKKELRKTAKIRAGQVVGVGDVRITVKDNDP
jgi:ribosome-associated protein